MESIPGIIVSGEIPRRCWTANRSIERPEQDRAINDGALNTKTNHATGELAPHDENPMRSQRCGFTAEQIAAPQTVLHVAEERQPGWEPDSGAELFSAVRTNLPVSIMRPAKPRFTTAISRSLQFPAA